MRQVSDGSPNAPTVPGARARRDWYTLEERHAAIWRGRVVAIAALAAISALAPLDLTGRERALGVAACAGALLADAALSWLPRRRPRTLLAAVNAALVVDALLVLALAALSDGTESPALWLLPLLVLGTALGLSVRTGVKAAILSALVVGTLQASEAPDEWPSLETAAPLLLALAVLVVAGAATRVNERELVRQRELIAVLHEASDAFARAGEGPLLARLATDAAERLLPGWSVEMLLDGRPAKERAGREGGRVILELPVAARVRGEDGDGTAFGALRATRAAPRVGSAGVRRAQLHALRTLATGLAVALSQVNLVRRLEHQSMVDALTGLGNRRAFDQALEEELARTRRARRPVGLVLLDVDHFKRFNDEHGHQAGDLALTEVAAVIAATARTEDRACRIGGEEFALLLPGAGESEAVEVAERMRKGVQARRLPFGRVTVSIGVAVSDGSADGRALLAAADERLYAAKEGGRNRVVPA